MQNRNTSDSLLELHSIIVEASLNTASEFCRRYDAHLTKVKPEAAKHEVENPNQLDMRDRVNLAKLLGDLIADFKELRNAREQHLQKFKEATDDEWKHHYRILFNREDAGLSRMTDYLNKAVEQARVLGVLDEISDSDIDHLRGENKALRTENEQLKVEIQKLKADYQDLKEKHDFLDQLNKDKFTTGLEIGEKKND